MDNGNGDVDDLGSGWFEVKKKHRSSSKYTLQKSLGGSSHKIPNPSSRSWANCNSEGSSWHDRSQHPSLSINANDCVAESGSVKTTKFHGEGCNDVGANDLEIGLNASASEYVEVPEKLLVAEETSKSSSTCSGSLEKCACLSQHVKCSPKTDSVGILSNTPVKFGDFDEIPGLSLPSDSYRDNNSSRDHRHGEDAAHFRNEQIDENKLKADTDSCTIIDAASQLMVQGNEGTETCNDDKREPMDSRVIPDSILNVSGSMASVDSVSQSCSNNDHEVPATSSSVASTESRTIFHDQASAHADFGSETAESKERFRQRLWCFLFENLNRAVDELYLLCELECDMEQINESMLVLEEAISDFKELKSRAEHFDNTKKTPGLPKEGMPLTVKADHRRPHALSWEVRRMTSSPHRQEILSSSLEAFQRIQMELACKQAGMRAERFTSSSSREVLGSLSELTTPSATVRNISLKVESQVKLPDSSEVKTAGEKHNRDAFKSGRSQAQSMPSYSARSRRGSLEPISEIDKRMFRKDRELPENKFDRLKSTDVIKNSTVQLEKEKQIAGPWKSMDAWKEKRNWEDILKSPARSSRVSHSPGVGRKVTDRARVLHDKLMSPEKKKRSALDMKKEAEEKHARALRIRSQLESERVQRLQRTSEKLNRVNEWQAVRSSKLREVMNARHQRGESRHEAFLAQVAKRAGDESTKVNEVRFITSLNEENKKFLLRQKLHDSEMRRAEKLQVIKTKQKEDTAREEAVLERRKFLEAEKMQRLAEIQRKKEEAIFRREEERKASSAAREARAAEQQRRKEIRAKAQQEEAELLAQKLAEKLRESEQRRKYYLEQIRERASMDLRDQPSPFQRRFPSKDGQNRSTSANSTEDPQTTGNSSTTDSMVKPSNNAQIKRRIKKIRQRLMALKHEFIEPSISESTGMAHRAALGAAKAKLSRWLQDLQRLRQARKEGAASIGLIVGDITKYLEGKDLELHASRQIGLLDFIASALPASHTSKPGACQVTAYLLHLLRVLLSLPANRTYFLVQNLLPPIIPMLSASLENYIKVAASNSGSSNILSKTSTENTESSGEVLDGFLWTVTMIVGHVHLDDEQLQMQGGLIELIVAYQIIHRLRDLFALYDRPQVEGSPLPSSILFGLNLLAVLTSKPGSFSTIDWESCKCRTLGGKIVLEYEYLTSQDSMGNQLMTLDQSGDAKLPTMYNELTADKKSCQQHDSSISRDRKLVDDASKDLLVLSAGLNNSAMELSDLGVTTEKCFEIPSQGDENSTADSFLEGRKVNNACALYIDSPRKGNETNLKHPVMLLLSSMAETGLVSLPSLLTAVLLQANNRSSSEQASAILPSNFEEVATGVLKVLNNMARLDITLLQHMLARSDLKMEFFHLISFLLSHCMNKWRAANDQVGLLLLESLLLLGYFSLFHAGNQSVLRWGKSPTILHKVCDLPFVFFSDPELMPILAAALIAVCYGCDQNLSIVQQEISTDMLRSLLKSCQTSGLAYSESVAVDGCGNHSSENIQSLLDNKSQADIPIRSNRRSGRPIFGKGISGGIKFNRNKVQKEGRATRAGGDVPLKQRAGEASSKFMLHRKIPASFLDRVEEFFCSET